MNRRDFLKSLGLLATAPAFLNSTLLRAATLPALGRRGTLEDVQHVVILMQENRSFDHYFGSLRGVRGYDDRFPILLPSGRPVWQQPRMLAPERAIAPFHLDTRKTSAQLIQDLDHGWASQHAAMAGGLMDAWPLNKTDMTMGYFTRADLPFHYALADAFTVCDQYFASLAGPTCPNRCMLWSGSINPAGDLGGPFIDDDTCLDDKSIKPFAWTTYPQRLQDAGVSWQIYQQGMHEIDHNPFTGNFEANALAYFSAFQDAAPGSALHARAMTPRPLRQLKADVLAGRLPQVSWIVPPAAYSEHPSYPPAYGAMYIARVLDALTANPEVWGRTVLLLDYDENDGFFDHLMPPQPPGPARPGKSTVSTAGEIHDIVNPRHRPLYEADQLPYGLGPRVPMFVISPWSRGGYVCSQVFDHTSTLRFLEQRFGVAEPNISQWRRAVCGDLTSALDFSRHDAKRVSLPDTRDYRRLVDLESRLPAPTVPAEAPAHRATQEQGLRPARALPYHAELTLAADARGYTLRFHNASSVAVCCYAYWDASRDLPQRYTLGAGHALEDHIAYPADGPARMTVRGPNGFLRALHGRGPSRLALDSAGLADGNLRLTLRNAGDDTRHVTIRDMTYAQPARQLVLPPGQSTALVWNLSDSHHWYDLEADDGSHQWRLAGHVEDGHASFSDPAIGRAS